MHSVAEYDEEMKFNATQVEEWQRKAEAFDKGVDRLAVYNGKGDFMWTDNYLEKPQKADLPVGCHYRTVRVCEVAEQPNEKGTI